MADKRYPYREKGEYQGVEYDVKAKTAKELGAKVERKKEQIRSGTTRITSTMTVKAWGKVFLETYKKDVVEKSYRDYEYRLDNFICPEIGNMLMREVRPAHLTKILNNMAEPRYEKDDKGNVVKVLPPYSQDRIDKMHSLMAQMFRKAKSNSIVAQNPAEDLDIPRGTPNGTHRSITPEERYYTLETAKTHKHGIWIKLILFCGLRTDETRRVRKNHIDPEGRRLWVDGTKSPKARRYIPLGSTIFDDLMEYIADIKDPFDYIFKNQRGNQLTSKNCSTMWNNFKREMDIAMGCEVYRNEIKKSKIAKDLVPYCYRHTFCTDLRDAGVPILDAAELMGHEDPKVTSMIYTHWTEAAFQKSATKIEEGALAKIKEVEALMKSKKVKSASLKLVETQ